MKLWVKSVKRKLLPKISCLNLGFSPSVEVREQLKVLNKKLRLWSPLSILVNVKGFGAKRKYLQSITLLGNI
jgi:hypothetical protein